MVRDVIILGSGVSGLTAAIYTGRSEFNPLIIEGMEGGGQLATTTEVENFPGFPEGVMGPELIQNMRKQAEKFGAEFVMDEVIKVDFSKKPFILESHENKYEANAVIIATGASARYLGLPEDKQYIGRGLSTCATCDGFFYRGKEIAVVGGGDSACEEADYLTKFADKVNLIHRRDELRASKAMQKRVFDNPKIEIHWNKVVKKLQGEPKISSVILEDTKTHEESELKLDGVFYALGHVPNTKIFQGQIDLDEHGFIVCKDYSTKTNIDGIFACGDVRDSNYMQAITAAGSGCMAALDVEKYLVENK